ncbi:MAG TPA: FtsW/RodA/SpoVE family cell cycle protein [Anaerolineales bacterium]|nr:FtsW/RodA/SpoVE family cell cycle protein [Anaerolineales bacterium]
MQRETWRHFDFWLLGAVAVLVIFGLGMIRSAIAGNEELLELFPRHIVFAIVGFFVVVVTASLDYHLFNPIGKVLYWLVAVLLGLVAVGGQVAFGAQRAIDTGLFFIQPSELAKIASILVLADFFTRNAHRKHDLRWIARSLIPTLAMVVAIFLQPDLSTSIVLMVIWFALLWASGLKTKYIVMFALAGIAVAAIGFPFLQEYQQQRVFTFLFPDPNETFGNNYNVTQALITVGSGGWFGQGYGQGSQVQLRFLKVRHTDFIFSALANEFGFVGALVVLALLGFVMYRCLRAARLAKDTFGALICYGVTTYIFFHTAVNIGMNLNLIPVTGLPLPFVSMGGSSLLSTLLGIGLVESVVLRHKALEF